LGAIQQDQGDYEGARQHYQQALEIEEKLGNLSGMAKSYHQLGMLQQYQGDYEGARQRYQQALEIEEKLGDPMGMAYSFGQLGLLMRQVDRDLDAFQYTLQALLIVARLQVPEVKMAINQLCEITRDNPDAWPDWLSKSIEDEETRKQIKTVILENMNSEENHKA
jgi:tetratricopeptide (TPR) repeat protein